MSWFKDTAERVGRTALVAYLTYWVTLSTHDFSDFVSHQALLVATGSGVGTLLLCLGAAKVNTTQGEPASASFAKETP